MARARTQDTGEAARSIRASELLGHVRFLAGERLRGRRAGTEHAAIAAAYVAAEMLGLGLRPAGDEGGYEQAFPSVVATKKADGSWKVTRTTQRNVLAWLPGADPSTENYLLVGAHFDHLGVNAEGEVFAGADDNASGVAVLLGVARALARGPVRPRHAVLFVAFGAEEQGLRGSMHLVRHPPRSLRRLLAMINLDMVGRGRFLERERFALLKRAIKVEDRFGVGVFGGDSSPVLGRIARRALEESGLRPYEPRDFPLLAGIVRKMVQGRSDHAPFERLGIPFLFFSTGEHDDDHRPTDTIEKLDGEAMRRIARAVTRTVLAIDALEERPEFVRPRKGKGRR